MGRPVFLFLLAAGLGLAPACASKDEPAVGPLAPPPPDNGAGAKAVPPQHDPTPAVSADGTVETHRATSLGTRSFSANGRVQPHGRPTRTWFEYGKTTAYGNRTETRSLGPRLAAHYKESYDTGLSGWLGGVEASALVPIPTGGAPGAYVRFSEPTKFDPNHEDGVGHIQLAQYLHVGTFLEEGIEDVAWGGGDPDLRDARVGLQIRGTNWRPSTSELVFWAQSDVDLAAQNDDNWQRSNWAMTGFSLSDAVLAGGWQRVDYRLTNDTNEWSFGGKSIAQDLEVGRERYVYWSIDDTLRHLNCNVQHVLAHVLLTVPAEGSIDGAVPKVV